MARMQCPSCLGSVFEPSGDGRLVCSMCGEELQGFQEEEMDANLAGVTMMNRQSQSSQAYATRQSLLSKQESAIMTPVEEKPVCTTDKVLICEGVFIYLKALSDQLVKLRYVSSQIYNPLFRIAAQWVCRSRIVVPPLSHRKQIFAMHHALSMVCLAAVYIRSPLLPRDMCRLVATQQVPYLAVLKTVFPSSFRKTPAIRMAFTPNSMPIATCVIHAAIELATDSHAWLPIKLMFESSSRPGRFTKSNPDVPNSERKRPVSRDFLSAFPIGHLHLTLLRITRLLGLPDTFGARVMRWIGLRTVAMDWWYKIKTSTSTKCDAVTIQEVIPQISTDESVTADVVNSLRLCYGRRGQKPLHEPFSTEWETCKRTMARWLERGTAEDLDTVLWTCLSTSTLTNLQGKRLERYVQLVDDVLTGRGEEIPELWGLFVSEFQEIARSDTLTNGDDQEQDNNVDDDGEAAGLLTHVQTYRKCMYDETRCGPIGGLAKREGLEEMERECGYGMQSTDITERTTLAVAVGREQEAYKRQRRSRTRQNWPSSNVKKEDNKFDAKAILVGDEASVASVNPGELPSVDTGGCQKNEGSKVRVGEDEAKKFTRDKDWYPLWEPSGIGLAWTIIIKFFKGCNLEVEGMDMNLGPQSSLQRVRAYCDRTMQITMKFVDHLEAHDGFLRAKHIPKEEAHC